MSRRRRVALVTGSGRNIGRAIVLALAAGGVDLIVNVGSSEPEGRAVAEEAPPSARSHPCCRCPRTNGIA